jgi:hypothetical protein
MNFIYRPIAPRQEKMKWKFIYFSNYTQYSAQKSQNVATIFTEIKIAFVMELF